VALFAALVLAAHGATYLAQKTDGPVHDRAARLARVLWVAAAPGFVAVSCLTGWVRPELFAGLASRPLAWLGAACCAACVGALAHGLAREDHRRAFLGSTFLIQGVLATGAAALYPVMLFSTLDPENRLVAAAAAAPRDGMVAAAVWWPIAAALAFAYFFSVLRYYGSKVSASRDARGPY
jgi:cytochrome bd ubiquinol oxidase subunit II